MPDLKKTGGQGSTWWVYDSPKPAPVEDVMAYWGYPPPRPSERCEWWLHQIEQGWRPNKHLRAEGYHSSAEWYGVYIWEYLNKIYPALHQEGHDA